MYWRESWAENQSNCHTLLELLQALKGDFELVLVGEFGGVVVHLNPKERHDRHGGGFGSGVVSSCAVKPVSKSAGTARTEIRLAAKLNSPFVASIEKIRREWN